MSKGFLPVQMPVTDRDEENNPNSEIVVTMLSQSPLEPKIGVKQLHNRLAQLTMAGCFDYDVRVVNNLSFTRRFQNCAEISNVPNIISFVF